MEKVDLEGLDPPIEPAGEKAHRGVRMALAMVPGVGGPLVEVFNSVVESPLSKRRWETVQQIGEVINQLLDEGVVTTETLENNDAFISTVAEACSISLRNHQKEKLDALKNAVKNSALASCPPDDYRQMFLRFVDVCTVTHIKLLTIFNYPRGWFEEAGIKTPTWYSGSLSTVIDLAMPELNGHREIRDSIWKDLYQRGLVSTDSLNSSMSADGMLAKRTTSLGEELIRFLS
ncbi:hypothetical protein [Pseudomonas sp.]|uniref:hypothetical protein n=1 Tax=Pseudomonas sp. TaxID=306 RepID=UPI0028B20ABF|nr:hypothetical protein [Pseudomonas sp.]